MAQLRKSTTSECGNHPQKNRNITATDDRLRDELSELFKYFFALERFPFTVAGHHVS
jgi:hypothetical protein